jgi:hypothetical protein
LLPVKQATKKGKLKLYIGAGSFLGSNITYDASEKYWSS